MNNRRDWEKIIPIIILVLFVIVFVVTLAVRIRNISFTSKKQEKYDELFVKAVRMYETELTEPTQEDSGGQGSSSENDDASIESVESTSTVVVDFNYLWNENKDIVAWISIPGTDIDYPIVQADDNEYYLNRNLDGSTGRPACIFLDCHNNAGFTDSMSVVYGHNMRNGTMFGKLKDFQDADYFAEHRELNIYLPNETKNYQIVIASVFSDEYLFAEDYYTGQDGRYIFQGMQANEASLFVDKLLKYGDKKANFSADYEIGENDQILVLSTCCRDTSKRLLIVCKEIN